MSLHSCPNSQCTTPRVNPYVNYGLWMIMMCQCVFIYCNKYTALMEDVVNGGSCACMVSESIWEISVSFAQLMLLMEEACMHGVRDYMGNLCIICSIFLCT